MSADLNETRQVMIRLEKLTKHYPGQQSNAVDGLDLEINEGEIVVLVGPARPPR